MRSFASDKTTGSKRGHSDLLADPLAAQGEMHRRVHQCCAKSSSTAAKIVTHTLHMSASFTFPPFAALYSSIGSPIKKRIFKMQKVNC